MKVSDTNVSRDKGFFFRMDYSDLYKLDFCTEKTGLEKSELIRGLIDGLFHDLDPPFREFSS
jgi:hypothetical protein